jgi:hypothetical protein
LRIPEEVLDLQIQVIIIVRVMPHQREDINSSSHNQMATEQLQIRELSVEAVIIQVALLPEDIIQPLLDRLIAIHLGATQVVEVTLLVVVVLVVAVIEVVAADLLHQLRVEVAPPAADPQGQVDLEGRFKMQNLCP